MPWEATTVIDQRVRFVMEYQRRVMSGEVTMTDLCREHGIAPKTGYKALRRYAEGSWSSLADRSRAPRSGAHWTPLEIRDAVIAVRRKFPRWGARKILVYLNEIEPRQTWPSASTAHELLRRAQLIDVARRQRCYPHPGRPPQIELVRPNQRWSVDFKGHFRTRDRRYCYPLTVADSFSRYVLGCDALAAPSLDRVWTVFERLFREYGLPETILSDNGAPFASNSVARLSKLSVRWIRLGIAPHLIEPGKPQQNGSHERMHRTLKAEACIHPSNNCREQQTQFEAFRQHFNHVRPHEALDQRPPARLYNAAARTYPARLPQIEYANGFEVRRVRSSGEIKWQGQWHFISEALVGEPVAFEAVADGIWLLRFATVLLGYYSERDRTLSLDRKTKPAGKEANAPRFPLSHRHHD